MSEKTNLKTILIAIVVVGSIITVSYFVINNRSNPTDGANNRPPIAADETAQQLQKFTQIKENIKNDRANLYQVLAEDISKAKELGTTTDSQLNIEYTNSSLRVRKQEFESKQKYVEKLKDIDCEVLSVSEKDECNKLKQRIQNWLVIYQKLHTPNVDFSDGYTKQEKYQDELLTRENLGIDGLVGFIIHNERNPDMVDLTY